MNLNVGKPDRVFRVVIGLLLITFVAVGPQTPWGWIGIVPLLTGLFGWCPAYRLLKFNTCKPR